jgi:hypothetical protein
VAEPAVKLEKARLSELKSDFATEVPGGRQLTVQFNPETLKVSFANQIAQPPGGADQRGPQGRQFVGAGTIKLALQLWLDVTAGARDEQGNAVTDVRQLTRTLAYFITPQEVQNGKEKAYVPPGVRFAWGSFQFDGLLDSMEESLEFFSPDGRPLRASVSLTLSQQKISDSTFKLAGRSGAAGGAGTPQTPGTRPLAPGIQGTTLQAMADARGLGGDWQRIAAANGIENPRQVAAGRLIDLDLQLKLGGSR